MKIKKIKQITSLSLSLAIVISTNSYAFENISTSIQHNAELYNNIEQKIIYQAQEELKNSEEDSELELINSRKQELLNIIKATMDYAGLTQEEKDFIFAAGISDSGISVEISQKISDDIFGKIIIEELTKIKEEAKTIIPSVGFEKKPEMLLNMLQVSYVKPSALEEILVILQEMLSLNKKDVTEMVSVLASNLAKNPNMNSVVMSNGKTFEKSVLDILSGSYQSNQSQAVLAASMTVENSNLNPYYHEKFFKRSNLYSHVKFDKVWDTTSIAALVLIAAGFLNIFLDKKVTVEEKRRMEKDISKVVTKGKPIRHVSLKRKDLVRVGKVFAQQNLRKVKVDLMRLMLKSDITWSFGFHNAKIYIVRSFLQTAVMVFFFSKGSPKDLTSNMEIMHEFYLLNLIEQKKRTLILSDKIEGVINDIDLKKVTLTSINRIKQIERANTQIIVSEKEALEDVKILYKTFYAENGIFVD